jgi:uncharacterized protein YhdP
MHTDRLQIDGPAARVVMRGEADLKNETQHLNVTVQPELRQRRAGVAVINPLAGIATLLADKMLQNPAQQGVQFRVSGDRQVGRPQGREESLGVRQPRAPAPE